MSIVTLSTNAKQLAQDMNISARELRIVMQGGLHEVGQRAESDYGRGTRTWDHKPRFTREVETRSGRAELLVGTDDEIFGYVDRGTRPHMIFPRKAKALRFRPGSSPKTQPGHLGSGAGRPGGNPIFRAWVRHPGGKPRGFTRMVQERMNKYGPAILDKHLKKWVRKQNR